MDTLDLPALVRTGERRIRGRVIREFIVVIVWLVILLLTFVVAQPSIPPVPFSPPVTFYLLFALVLLTAILDVGVRLWPQVIQSQGRRREVRQLIKELVPDLQVPEVKVRQSARLFVFYGFAVMLFVAAGANLALRSATDGTVIFARALVGGGLMGYIIFRLLTNPGFLGYFISDFRVIERYLQRGQYDYVLERTEYNIPESKRRDLYRLFQAQALMLAGRLKEAQQRLLEMLPHMYQSGAGAGFAFVACLLESIALIEHRYDEALAWQCAAVKAAPEWELVYLGMIDYYLHTWSYPERLQEFMAAVERFLTARALISMSAAYKANIYLTFANGAAFCGDHADADAYFSDAWEVIPRENRLLLSSAAKVAAYMALYRGDRERARASFERTLSIQPNGLSAILAREGLTRCDTWSPDAIKREEVTHE